MALQTNGTQAASQGIAQFLLANTGDKVNEEQLFAAILQDRLTKHVSKEAASEFRTTIESVLKAASEGKKHIQVEDAAVKALDSLVAKKTISQEVRNKVYAEAFRAAQLDNEHNYIWDSKGGDKDNTVAVEEKAKALTSVADILSQIDSGKLKADMPKPSSSSSAGSSATTGSGSFPKGFLFKPVSNNSGTLSILFPASSASRPKEIRLVDSSGNLIEKGRFTSMGDTGDRAKFAFSKRGDQYPSGLVVEVVLSDGSVQKFSISDPGKRYE